MRDVDAADPKGTTGCQSMCVVADANSKPVRSSISLCADGLRRETKRGLYREPGKEGNSKSDGLEAGSDLRRFCCARVGKFLERFDLDCGVIFN